MVIIISRYPAVKLKLEGNLWSGRDSGFLGFHPHLHILVSELALCIILVPEIVSALNRRLRERLITIKDYRKAKQQFLDDVRDATVLQVTPAVISHAVNLLEKNVLRAMDALHVACALEWQADLFITSDKRQFIAAKSVGLETEYAGRQNSGENT